MVEESLESSYRYYYGQAQEIKDMAVKVTAFAEALEGVLGEGYEEKVAHSRETFTLTCSNSEKARDLVQRIMEEWKEIEKFVKVFITSEKEPTWVWVAEIEEMTIRIIPATPDPDCLPRQVVNTYNSWVCK
jgi:hypothetical protein